MLKTTLRWAALAASALTLSTLAACGATNAPPAAEAPPPPPAAQLAPPPELLGGPPPREFTTMAPIPNPEDMTPAERARVYGRNYEWRRLHRHHAWSGGMHHAWRAPMASAPAQPAAVAPAPVAKPAAVAAPAPVATPVAATVLPPIQRLQAAVADVGKTSTLAVPADLSAAKPGNVTVSLPSNLFAAIRDEAAKLGLIKEARKAEVTATLSGDGYVITPSGAQTAQLKAGKPTVFSWQVLPTAGAKGALKADVSAVLKGAGAAESFSLAHLEQTVASVEAAMAAQAPKGLSLKAPSKMVVGIIIGIIAILILLFAARAASSRREAEERRRRFRTMAASNTMDSLEPVGVATPVAAAAVTEAPMAREVFHSEPVTQVYAEPVHVAPEPAVVETAPVEAAHVEEVVPVEAGPVEAVQAEAAAPAEAVHHEEPHADAPHAEPHAHAPDLETV